MTRSGNRTVHFVSHPEVVIDPAVPIVEWPLSPRGRERMARACEADWARGLTAVYSSAERKALDGAEILSAATGLSLRVREDLGENDRSATGYLPPAEFEATADRFFAEPTVAVRGWATAADEQRRIVWAVDAVIAEAPGEGDIAIVSHGAVGALLLAHLTGHPISRELDQSPGGGNRFAFASGSGVVHHGWRPIEDT